MWRKELLVMVLSKYLAIVYTDGKTPLALFPVPIPRASVPYSFQAAIFSSLLY